MSSSVPHLPVASCPSSEELPRLAIASLRALCVEDHDDTRDMIAELLELDGFEVETAASVGDALRLLGDGHRYDLVLTDYMMPDGSGTELLDAARANGQIADAHVVLFTAHPAPPRPANTLVIRKPLEVDSFLRTINELVCARAPRGGPAACDSDDDVSR
jgi:CheY-like chemotaxis protein